MTISIASRWLRLVLATLPVLVTLLPQAASGQPRLQADPSNELSPEELAEIERAVGADTSAAEQKPTRATDDSKTAAASTLVAFLPDIALVADLALAYFSDEEAVLAGGHDPSRNGFNLQQLELSLSKNVDPYFRLDANLVVAEHGVELEEAYATTLALPGDLQARAGQLLTRFGRINAQHLHARTFIQQPFMFAKVFGGEGNRGLGAELSWLAPLPWFVELVGSSTHASGSETARSFFGAADQPVRSPLDLQHTLAVKQFFALSHNWSLLWGLSAANGPNPNGKSTRTDVLGTDVYLKYRPITRASYTTVAVQAEWLYRRRQVAAGKLLDTGGYAHLLWRFAKRWSAAIRYEYGSPVWDGAAQATVDPLDPEQTAARHRTALGLGFRPTEFSRLRLQASGDFPGWHSAPNWAALLGLEVVAGAHGAHKF